MSVLSQLLIGFTVPSRVPLRPAARHPVRDSLPMNLFIGKLLPETTPARLSEQLVAALSSPAVNCRYAVKIDDLQIIEESDQISSHRYGLVTLQGDDLPPRVISTLHDELSRTTGLSIRPYHERSKDRDRRRDSVTDVNANRRVGERRKKRHFVVINPTSG